MGTAIKTNINSKLEVFGHYILLKKLAIGGMAEVFLARPISSLGNGRVLVLKRLLPHIANHSTFLSMFQKEIQVIMGFNHPNTVQLHDFGKINEQPYIAMEYIEGKNLKDLIGKVSKRKEMIPIPVALSLMTQAASGLAYAHSFVNKITGEEIKAIHRDISPHNLIISYEGNLKVIDFGIAKSDSLSGEKTQVGTIKGKIAYLSPEQAAGIDVDIRADIFALGIVAWELLTLRRPFSKKGDSEETIINAIKNCDLNLVAPSTYNPHVSAELDQVVLNAIRKSPTERYSSADAFQKALRNVMLMYFPDHTYADTGKWIRSVFETEIQEEQKELITLNQQAQQDFSVMSGDPTMVIGSEGPTNSAAHLSDLKTFSNSGENVIEALFKEIGELKQNIKTTSSEKTLYPELLEDPTTILPKPNLQAFESGKKRVFMRGDAVIYNLRGKIISKVSIKNCSTGGMRIETGAQVLKTGDAVMAEFCFEGLGLGPIKSRIRWICPINGHRQGHRFIGLQFTELPKAAEKKLEAYLKTYYKNNSFEW